MIRILQRLAVALLLAASGLLPFSVAHAQESFICVRQPTLALCNMVSVSLAVLGTPVDSSPLTLEATITSHPFSPGANAYYFYCPDDSNALGAPAPPPVSVPPALTPNFKPAVISAAYSDTRTSSDLSPQRSNRCSLTAGPHYVAVAVTHSGGQAVAERILVIVNSAATVASSRFCGGE